MLCYDCHLLPGAALVDMPFAHCSGRGVALRVVAGQFALSQVNNFNAGRSLCARRQGNRDQPGLAVERSKELEGLRQKEGLGG